MPLSPDYRPRTPPQGVLYRLVRDHFETFRAEAAALREGDGLPRFVEQEFRDFLLNVHVHALVLDGVFVVADGRARFCPLPGLTTADVADVLATVVPRVRRLLAWRGLGPDEACGAQDRWSQEAPVLAGMAAASVQGRVALGRRAGSRVRRSGGSMGEDDDGESRGEYHARQDAFDLHAAVRVGADGRARLERLCRYALRPPVAQDRLRLTADGQVVLTLKRRWADGTTAIVFEPVELLERLAVLTPRPRVNLLLYHGVLAPRAAWRRLAVEFGRAAAADEVAGAHGTEESASGPRGLVGARACAGRN